MQALLARARVDQEFRQRLLADPRSAIHHALGITIPPDFRIKFVERGPDLDALVVLPDLEASGGADELSDDELEAVTGGTEAEEAAWSDEVVPEEPPLPEEPIDPGA